MSKQELEELETKIKELSEKDLSEVNGGAFMSANSFQLKLYGNNLPMNKTVAEVCSMYPEIKDALGNYYNAVSNMTLNLVCLYFGQDLVQGLIDDYTKKLAK